MPSVAGSSEGIVSSYQISGIIKSIGQNPSEAEIQVNLFLCSICEERNDVSYFSIIFQDMVNQVDMDGTGTINFPEFLKMMCMKVDAENFEDQVREAFLVFDQVT